MSGGELFMVFTTGPGGRLEIDSWWDQEEPARRQAKALCEKAGAASIARLNCQSWTTFQIEWKPKK